MKKVTAFTLGIIIIGMGLAFAQQTPQPSQSVVHPIDVGNKICPVSGNPIGVMGPGVGYEYNGKIYHLCCSGCLAEFKKNPEKYSKIAEDEAKSLSSKYGKDR